MTGLSGDLDRDSRPGFRKECWRRSSERKRSVGDRMGSNTVLEEVSISFGMSRVIDPLFRYGFYSSGSFVFGM